MLWIPTFVRSGNGGDHASSCWPQSLRSLTTAVRIRALVVIAVMVLWYPSKDLEDCALKKRLFTLIELPVIIATIPASLMPMAGNGQVDGLGAFDCVFSGTAIRGIEMGQAD